MYLQLSPKFRKENQLHLKTDTLVHEAPWQHFILDNVFALNDFINLQERILSQNHEFKIGSEDPEQIQLRALPDMALAEALLSEEFQGLLEKVSGSALSIYKSGALQLRRMTPDSPAFPPHYDFIDHRTLVMLYYLGRDWTPANGGELLLHKEEGAAIDGPDTKWISPIANRMVLFFCDETNWHSVRQVINWNRYLVFAEWSVVSNERIL
ncbi:2OG-Fe(II) oxygenase [Bdellovibrio svalbardensis]|uniref:2OG-Fe(II) oxygenase n=1 Tax=Bdellovibrio svalbardensis TaxID=2972972 RepID=A0ABT6DIQ6_9BACT|nr:2OG-Fe(II) oxygenase [Bdellovibrio svalbardensis]MDG0816734.1 2OG-Fe(II) oxygenase [Bdellovibrio svalbardensis]